VAGRIPQNFIDDLIARSDIVEVINARVPLKRKGKEFSACCPFHNEKTPSFTVSENKQFFYCFGCHAKGNVIGFLMDYEHLSYIDAIESLAADAHVDVPHEDNGFSNQNKEDKQPYYKILEQASELFQQELKTSARAIDYLKQRGLSGEIAKQFKIGYAPDGWNFLSGSLGKTTDKLNSLIKTGLVVTKENDKVYDRFRDRIIFPITDQRGRIIGFGGRILDQGEPKYLNSPENTVFHKGYELYGLYETKQALRKIDRIIVVEGYMDVVALAQHGINYAVASLGTATTTEQIQKTFRTTHEIVYCYDGDNAGKKAAWRALENTLGVIRDGMIAKFLFLPEKEDPDTMVRKEGKEAFEERIKNAKTLSDFLFENLKSEIDISSTEGKAQVASKANALIHLESKISTKIENKKTAQTLTKPARGQQISNNKTRLAVALLIQNPILASHHKAPDMFKHAANKGLQLLHTLQQTIASNPDISAAALLERFRDGEHENALSTLSMLQTPETENDNTVIDVYKEVIERLHREERSEYLKNKLENNEQLSPEEWNEYLEKPNK